MKLKLQISKNFSNDGYYSGGYPKVKSNKIRFAVIDLDISNKYPLNFVCLLPRYITLKNTKNKNKFQLIFKNDSKKIATQLLQNRLKKEKDEDLIREIKDRLKMLNPKPKLITKCNVCGKDFIPRKFGYVIQKTCNNCWKENKTKKTYDFSV
jgi:hypothetical protein